MTARLVQPARDAYTCPHCHPPRVFVVPSLRDDHIARDHPDEKEDQ